MAELKAVPVEDTEEIASPLGPMRLPKGTQAAFDKQAKDTRWLAAIKSALLGLPADAVGLARFVALGHVPGLAVEQALEQKTGKKGTLTKIDEQIERPLRDFARREAGLTGERNLPERLVEGALSPLALIPPLKGANIPIAMGVGGVANAAVPLPDTPVAPEARATALPASTPPSGTTSEPPLRAVPVEEGEGPLKAVPVEEAPLRAVPVDEAAQSWTPSATEIGLGAAGTIAAALLGRRALQAAGVLKRPVPGKAIQTIGEPLDARVQRPSATTPGEAIQTLQADKTAVLRSQVARSVQGVNPAAPVTDLQRAGVDVYTTGIPFPGTSGERGLVFPTNRPIIPPAPFPQGMTVEQAVRRVDELLPRATPEQVTMRMMHGFETGEIEVAGRKFKTIPLKQVLDRVAMRGEEHVKRWDEALALARALDASKKDAAPILTRLLSGSKPTTSTPSGALLPHPKKGQVDQALRAQAEARYAQLLRDPAVYDDITQIQGILNAMIKNAPHAGYPVSKVQKFLRAYPRFVPIQEQGKEARNPNIIGRMERWLKELGDADPSVKDSLQTFDTFMKASKVHGQGVQNPASFADSIQRYFATYYYAMERNHAKRAAFYFLRNSRDPDIAKSFSVFRKSDKQAPKETNWFYDGENFIGVHFKDPLANTAFKLNPHHIRWSSALAMKQGFQQGTTGLLNPKWLVAKGIFFDHLFGSALRPAGTKDFGGVTGLLTLGRGRVATDPTKIAHNVVAGATRVLAAKAKLALAEAAEGAVARGLGPMWSKWYESVRGPGSVARLGQAMRQAYEDSTYAWLRSEGAVGQTQFFERNLAMNVSRLEQLVPSWQRLGKPLPIMHRIVQGYKDILEAIAQSYRVQYVHYNRARKGVAREAVDLLGTFTRRGLGQGVEGSPILRDANTAAQQLGNVMARAFGGKYARTAGQAMMDSIPYYNTFVQATSKLGQRLKTTSGAMGAMQTIVVPAMLAQLYMSYDKELSDWYRQLPGSYRATTLFLPLPFMQDRPVHERVLAIPVAPEFSILHAGTSYAMAEVLGTNTSFQQDDLRDGIAMWLNVPFIGGGGMPPLIQAFGALLGTDLRGARVQSFEAGTAVLPSMGSALRTERLTGADYTARPGALFPAPIEGFLNGLFGTIASMAIGLGEAGLQTARKGELGQRTDPGLAMLTQLGNDTIRGMPVYRPIHGFYQQQAMSNMKRRLRERTALVDRITNTADALFRGPGTRQTYPGALDLQPEQMATFMRDPVFVRRLQAVKTVLDTDGAYKLVNDERNTIRRTLEGLKGRRPLTRQLQQRINVLQARELGLSERMYDLLKAKERSLGFRLEDADPQRFFSVPPGTGQR